MRYSIREQTVSDDWRYFEIDEITGEITTATEFDWEDKNYYLIEVKATDGEQSHEGLFDVNFFAHFFFITYFVYTIFKRFSEVSDNKGTSKDFEWSRKVFLR